MPRPGDLLGDYKLSRLIAFDIFGGLYAGEDLREHAPRLLYVLHPMVTKDTLVAGRLKEQMERIAALDHPNILRFRRMVTAQQYGILVADGEDVISLSDFVAAAPEPSASGAPSPGSEPEFVRGVLQQILLALQYGHNHLVTHLSLSPSRIVCTTDGKVKVFGFGLYQTTGRNLFEQIVSAVVPPIADSEAEKRPVSTSDLFSPEIRMGQSPDLRADVYAAGAIAYWLLSRTKPPVPYKPVRPQRPDLIQGWDVLLAKALERDPEQRYASATPMLKDLQNLETLKEATRVPFKPAKGSTKPAGKAASRLPRRTQLLILALFVLLTVGIGALWFVFSNQDEVPAGPNGERPVAVIAKPGKVPRLLIRTQPPRANVAIKPGNLTFPATDGELRLNMLAGTYTFTISAPNHLPAKIPLQISEDTFELDINLQPAWGILELTSTPGATVTATPAKGAPIPLGTVPESGLLRVPDKLLAGAWTLNLQKENYEPLQVGPLTLKAEQTLSESAFLKGYPATVTFTTDPAGAELYINEKPVGRTPITVADVPAGVPITVGAALERCRPLTRTLRVEPASTLTVDLGKLSAKAGTLQLALTLAGKPLSAEQRARASLILYAGETPVARVAALAEIQGVPEGQYVLALQHPEFQSSAVKVTVQDGQASPVNLDLAPKPGRLIVRAHPSRPVSVLVDGTQVAAAPDGSFPVPADAAQHTVEVAAVDYFTLKRQLSLRPNESFTWDAQLVPLPGPVPGKEYAIPYLGLALAWAPSGSYVMGSPLTEHARLPGEGPTTHVAFSKGFWIGRYELRQREYAAITNQNPSTFRGPERPVETLTWEDARRFCELLTQRERAAGRIPLGYEYRLPTEAEWEYAARAGTTTPFFWGETADRTHGNFRGTYPRQRGTIESERPHATVHVGQYPANPWGLHDTAGNVREWCLDIYYGRLPGGKLADAPAFETAPPTAKRASRGGSWDDEAVQARVAARPDGLPANTPSQTVGFRVVLAPVLQEARRP